MEKQEVLSYQILYSKIKNVYIQVKEGRVIVKAPKGLPQKEITKIIEHKRNWIEKKLEDANRRTQAKDLYTESEFIEIVKQQAKELVSLTQLKPNRIRVRDLNYAWGSCSSKKNISLNHQLIQHSVQAIRYVILHELCHLQYMNHSKDFWNLIATYMPNYKEIKKEFK